MPEAVLEIPSFPDLSDLRYAGRYGEKGTEMAARAIPKAASLLSPEAGELLCLRFLVLPDAGKRSLRPFLKVPTLEGADGGEAKLVGGHLLRPFYDLEETGPEEAAGELPGLASAVFLISQAEEVRWDDHRPAYSFSAFGARQGEQGPPISIDDLASEGVAPFTIDVVLRAARLSPHETAALRGELEALAVEESGASPERRSEGTFEEMVRVRDLSARRAREALEGVVARLSGPDVFSTTLRVVAVNDREGAMVARAVGHAAAGGAPFSVRRVARGDARFPEAIERFVRMDLDQPWTEFEGARLHSEILAAPELGRLMRWDEPRAVRLVRLARLRHVVAGASLEPLLRLPTSSGNPFRSIRLRTEVALERAADAGAPRVVLGRDDDQGGTVSVAMDQIVRHVLVSGTTGSGKTCTLQTFLERLWAEHHVPFLVLESAKHEYRRLVLRGPEWARDLRVLTPGNEGVSPVRFNPLEVPAGCTVEEHAQLIGSCFLAAVPTEGPLEALIRKSLRLTYADAGLRPETLGEECARFPRMDDVLRAVRKVLARQGYVGEVRQNLQAAVETRVESLCEDSLGRLFRCERSSPSLDELIRRPTVVELEGLNGAMNLFALFLLTGLLRRLRSMGPSRDLRAVIVVEEAHNLIPRQTSGQVAGAANAAAEATRLFVRLLAEIRAYGIGIVVVDQSPSAVAPEVLKNTGTKVIHRAADVEDRDVAVDLTLLGEAGKSAVSRLAVGQAFVRHDGMAWTARTSIDRVGGGGEVPIDEQLRSVIGAQEWFRELAATRTANDAELLLAELGEFLGATVRGRSISGRAWNAADGRGVVETVNEARRKLETLLGALRGRFPGGEADALSAIYRERFDGLVRAAGAGLAAA